MEVTRGSRTASRAFYLAYLQTAAWRTRRNRALKQAHFKCSKCSGKRDLQVHHLSYERLGAELDTDLRVLCFECHNEHHQDAAEATPLGIYLKLASEALRRGPFSSIADLSEDVKRLCAQHKIPGDNDAIAKALNMVCATRLPKDGKPYVSVVEVADDETPITHAQAVEWLHRINGGRPVQNVLKTMPEPKRLAPPRKRDAAQALQMVSAEILEAVTRCEALEKAVADETGR